MNVNLFVNRVLADGKESTYNAGDPSSIPGSVRSPGEGNGNLPGAGICILSAALSTASFSGSGIAQLEFYHCQEPA